MSKFLDDLNRSQDILSRTMEVNQKNKRLANDLYNVIDALYSDVL